MVNIEKIVMVEQIGSLLCCLKDQCVMFVGFGLNKMYCCFMLKDILEVCGMINKVQYFVCVVEDDV